MKPHLTVIMRSRGNETLDTAIKSVLDSSAAGSETEIVIVAFSDMFSDSMNGQIRTIKCSAKRIEAKVIGVSAARGEKIMFLDSDQTVAPDLIPKILNFDHDMGIVPERSLNTNVMAKLMNSKRIYTEKRMRQRIDLSLPVIPRVFNRELIEKTFNSLDKMIIKNVTETEDSIIFYEALKYSKDIGWIDSFIFNVDPGLKEFLMKSYEYGLRNERAILDGNLGDEYIELIRRIQFETLINNRSFSLSVLLLNLLRGVPYVIGSLNARFKKRYKA